MSGHAPGPWRYDKDNLNVYSNGMVAQIYGHIHNGEKEANAYRIVTCVNACEGLKNPIAIPNLIAAARKVLSGDDDETQTGLEELEEAMGDLGL